MRAIDRPGTELHQRDSARRSVGMTGRIHASMGVGFASMTGAICVLACLAASFFASEAQAVRTRYFRTEGYDAWKRGTLEGTSLREEGRLMAAPKMQRLGDPTFRSVWAMASAPDGKLFLATGDQGQVYVHEGKEEPRLLASVFNYELFAVAADGKGGCFVAGAPSGSIIHVGSDGATRTLFDAPEGLILALLSDGSGGVYAAAGERGRLYRVTAGGESKVVTESGDLHLRCLAFAGEKILAGTDGRGLVESIDPSSGQTRVLYDASEEEVVSLAALKDGSVLFAANPGDPASGGAPIEAHEEAGDSSGPSRGPSPTVYLMDPNGAVRPIWRASEKMIHDLLPADDGTILVATGASGAVYRIDLEGHETVLWRAEEEQVLSLASHRGEVFVGTANPGRLYRMERELTPDATYTSEVLDAQDQARWGALRWTGDAAGGRVLFQTRTGYTALPDDSWSAWSGDLSEPLGAQITSPNGRYLQWRVKLTAQGDRSPSIRRVEVAHVETNRPPAIASLSLSPDEPSFQGGDKHGSVSQTLSNGIEIDYSLPISAIPPPGSNDVPAALRQLRSIIWDVDDPDNDEMSFKLEIRQVGEDDFRLIAEDLGDPAYSLETGLLPDGLYELRVTATDAPGNAPGDARSASRLSPPFRVDNIPPTVSELKARRVDGPALLVSGTAQDQASPLRRMQVSIDGRGWKSLPPKDGILDSPTEAFETEVPLRADEHGNWVVVRVQDAAGNAGSFRAWLEP